MEWNQFERTNSKNKNKNKKRSVDGRRAGCWAVSGWWTEVQLLAGVDVVGVVR